MQINSAMQKELEEWVTSAARNYFQARWLHTSPVEVIDGIGYHLQQAIERIEKAFLIWHNTSFRPIHDLDELGKQCSLIDPELTTSLLEASIFTEFAGRGRYIGTNSEHSLEEVDDFFRVADSALDQVLRLLPSGIADIYRNYIDSTQSYL